MLFSILHVHRCVHELHWNSICRGVIGSGPVFMDTATEAGFEASKQNYTALGVNADAKCEAFLRAQYCSLLTFTCPGQVRCGPYNGSELGQCGINSCQCTGSEFIQQACNAQLKYLFSHLAWWTAINYYKTGEKPKGTNCTTLNICEYR